MKGTKKEVAKTINEIADGFKEIANDILNDCYDPKKWKPITGKMANVTTCLLVQNHTFQEEGGGLLLNLNLNEKKEESL